MKNVLLALTISMLFQLCVFAQTKDSCESFQELIKSTYNFKPAQLSAAEQQSKSLAMDRVWNAAKANRKDIVPCLRAVLEDPSADSFFRFDGSNLLVELDPSPASKRTQIRSYATVNLDDVDLTLWVTVLSMRGVEGFDTTEAAERWLSYPRAEYYLPEHGAHKVTTLEGGLFLYGSMEESKAVPSLLNIISQVNHPGRQHALALLMSEATPESVGALRQIDLTGFSKNVRDDVRGALDHPKLLKPRTKPKTSREEFLHAFQSMVKGDWTEFHRLVDEVPDGEKDVVAVMNGEDIPLIRQVRRLIIANANQHAIEFYRSFTDILMTLTLKYEVKP